MKGIELSRQWFETDGMPFLQKQAPDLLPYIAAGLAGHGSECFGFDDEVSRDHDFTAAFSLWIPEKLEPEIGYRLTRLYARLLKEFPPPVHSAESLFAASEYGVATIEGFFMQHLGTPGVPTNWNQWLHIPEYAFAEAINGAIFYDGPGTFTTIREAIRTGMPEDVRRKKLAARAAMMAQTGQYNFSRCLKHGERGAAHLALADFVRETISMIFLLNKSFTPYYKWMFRAMRTLPKLNQIAEPLEFLLTEDAAEEVRAELIEDICSQIAAELREQGLSSSRDPYLETHAVEITAGIKNREIRSLHLMEG